MNYPSLLNTKPKTVFKFLRGQAVLRPLNSNKEDSTSKHRKALAQRQGVTSYTVLFFSQTAVRTYSLTHFCLFENLHEAKKKNTFKVMRKKN
jgi:hypothetical protein